MNRNHFRPLKYVVVVGIVFTLLMNSASYGYATNFNYATNAKWSNNLNFMLCIANSQPKDYEGLFLNAVDEWKSRWPHFAYTVSYASGCHINVHIVKTHSSLTDHGYLGHTTLDHWTHGAITKADIILPTYTAGSVSPDVLVPMSETLFYRAALHEFGHALNLGHFDDNGEEPIDIMYPYPADDDQEQGISQRDIQALNWYYLGFFGQEVTVRTDKKLYESGETIKILGKVSEVSSGKVAVKVFDSNKKLYRSDATAIGGSGAFNYKMKVPDEMESGSYKVKVSYDSIIADASFDIKNNRGSEGDETLISEGDETLISEGDETLISEGRDTNLPLATEETVNVLSTQIVDHSGSEVGSIQPYEQVYVRSSLSSTFAEQTEATYIIQVKNSEGYTVEISSVTYNLASGLSTFSLSWLPTEPENYDVEVFLWQSISDPVPLIPTCIDLKASVT